MVGSDPVKAKDRILYVEPNDLPAFDSAVSLSGQRLDNIPWSPERLNISVDLQVVVPSRQYSPTAEEDIVNFNLNGAKYQSILSGVKLAPNENHLTDDWTVMSYQEIRNNRAGSKEMFGINSIQISFDSHMYPRVTMNFTDVRGSALMQPKEQRFVDMLGGAKSDAEVTKNLFENFFKFPYPKFLLSVKGIYGTCVTFVLSIEDFKSSFNSETGNYDVSVKFIGMMYGLYTDIPMNYLLIAPYIGSGRGGFTKNEYWLKQTEAGGAFHYNEDGKEGAPISTLLEFYSMYHTASDENGDITGADGESTQDMARLHREMAMLTGENGILSFFEDMEVNISPAPSVKVPDGNGFKKKVLFFSDATPVTFSTKFIDAFKKHVDDYVKEFPEGFNFNNEYKNISPLYRGSYTPIATEPVNFNADIICPSLTADESKKIKVSNEYISDSAKYAFVYSTKFREDIEAYARKLSAESDSKLESASLEMRDYFKELFSFSPTIENVMRMIFAHLDTFVHCFYDTVDQIKGSRTLASLGNFPKEYTDIESSSGSDAHVPPFTEFLVMNRGEDKLERMYPGSDSRLAGLPEVGLVEAILNGIGSMTSWQDAFIQAEEDPEYGEEADQNIEKMDFIPIMPSDIFYGGGNPYDTLNGSENVLYVLYFFICRIALSKIAFADIRKKNDLFKFFAEDEADNFVRSKHFKRLVNTENFVSIAKLLSKNANGNFYWNKYDDFLASMKQNMFTLEAKMRLKAKDGVPVLYNGIEKPDGGKTRDTLTLFDETYAQDSVKGFCKAFSSRAKKSGKFDKHFKVDDFNYEYATLCVKKRFIGADRQIRVGGMEGSYPVVPLTMLYKGNRYVPYTDATGKTSDYYFKENELFKDPDHKERMVFSDFNDFMKNGEIKYMSVPVVLGKVNVGGNYRLCNQLVVTKIGGSNINFFDGLNETNQYRLAYSFLEGAFFGKSTMTNEVGDILEGTIESILENRDQVVTLSKLEEMLLCGLFYVSFDNEAQGSLRHLEKAVEKVKLSFTEYDVRTLSDKFKEWVETYFTPRIGRVIGSYKPDQDSYYNRSVEENVVSLFKDTVTCLMFVDGVRKDMSTNENVNVYPETEVVWSEVETFFSKVSEAAGKKEDSGDASYTLNVDVNTEFGDSTKEAIYYTLKNLYDRWLSMQTREDFTLYGVEEEERVKLAKLNGTQNLFKDRSEFANFVYVDSFYNDISKKFLVNPKSLFNLIGDQFDGEASYNVLEFINKICFENKLLFKCLPVYSNVYSKDTFAEIFRPHSLYDGTSRTGRRIGNTYLIMYTYEPSHVLDIEQDKTDGVSYAGDSFDIADSLGEITQESLEIMRKKNTDGENNYPVCAFGVTAAKQNQSYFTKIDVNMDSPRVTDFAIMNKFQLANLSRRGGTTNIAGTGQDLYSIYSNRSYDCAVEMLGCANIMPMMYFQLNNVPMFKGAYMITKVEHSIQNNTMTTKFVGTRMPRRCIPLTKRVFSIEAIRESVNKLANNDMQKTYEVGEVSVGVNPSNGTTTFLKYNGANAIYNGQSTSFPKGKTFYAWAAVKQMTQLFKGKGGWYRVPFTESYESNSCGRCATAVQMFLMAGFNGLMPATTTSEADANEKMRTKLGFSGCDGYGMWQCLSNYGFVLIADKSTVNSVKLQAGDVCVMKKYSNGVNTGVGHVCMYVGKENGDFWVADYKQGKREYQGHSANWWAYNGSQIANLGNTEVLFYRFGGTISNEEKKYENS